MSKKDKKKIKELKSVLKDYRRWNDEWFDDVMAWQDTALETASDGAWLKYEIHKLSNKKRGR